MKLEANKLNLNLKLIDNDYIYASLWSNQII